MSHQIIPTHQFTTVQVIDINQASAKHVELLLAQAVLDADLDALTSLDIHTSPNDLAVIAEYQMMIDHDNFDKCLHLVKLACAAEARLHPLTTKQQ